MSLALTLLFVLATLYTAEARSAGAPEGACGTLTPEHETAQVSDPPYEIDLSVFEVGNDTGTYEYTPGMTYRIILTRTGTMTFRGFFVQARLMADDTTLVGTFATVTANTQLRPCPNDGSGPNGVTHMNPNTPRIEYEYVEFDWTAPAAGTGAIRFGYAVVYQFDTYWANERSGMVLEAGGATPTDSASGLAVSVVSLLLSLVPLLL